MIDGDVAYELDTTLTKSNMYSGLVKITFKRSDEYPDCCLVVDF
jgi:hypothetical protein